ncbi:MAG: DUF2442 domain-containing protein [Thermoanaerobaculia bacterium]|nr:DUF2442 domain-containing protein [Thermoanaerobaculia bacterium]
MHAVTSVRHVSEFRLWLRFSDGTEGEIDLSGELWGPVFEPLADPVVFAQVAVNPELRTIVWPNGADFAPEFLYSQVRAAA